MTAHIKIKGQKELREKLRKVPKRVKAAEARAVKAQTHQTAEELRRDAPRDTGELERSIQEEISNKGMTGTAAITARHAEFVIHGTSRMAANDFVTPVINRTRRQFPKRVRKELEKELGGE